METHKLEVFLAVADERNFTRAADQLHMVQSGVTASIQSLEAELGTRLFDRAVKPVALSAAGRVLLPHARGVLASVRDARQAVGEVSAGVRGPLELGILYGLTPVHIRDALAEFRRRLPLVDIRLAGPGTGGASDHLEAVRDGRLDLAVVLTIGRHPGIALHTLAREQLLLACPAEHRLADRDSVRLAELVEEPFIDFPPGWGLRNAVERAFARAGISEHITSVQISDLTAVVDLVRLGLGVSFIPASTAAPTDGLRLLSVADHPPAYTISLAAARARRLSPAASQFVKIALEQRPAH